MSLRSRNPESEAQSARLGARLGARLAVVLVLSVACESDAASPARRADPASSPGRPTPYAYTSPAPPATPTALDGTYSRRIGFRRAGRSVPCRRCAPYRLEASRSTLVLEEGRFYVADEPMAEASSGFESTGHYVVTRRRITLFNDPACTRERGTYSWSLDEQGLELEVADDPCFTDLRAEYLTARPWKAAS